MKTTKITFENEYGIYGIEVNKSDMSIQDVFNELLAPVLLAAGYAKETIQEWQV